MKALPFFVVCTKRLICLFRSSYNSCVVFVLYRKRSSFCAFDGFLCTASEEKQGQIGSRSFGSSSIFNRGWSSRWTVFNMDSLLEPSVQWTAWTPRARAEGCASRESATALWVGAGQDVRAPGPPAWTSAPDTEPSWRRRGPAAVIPTGRATTAPQVRPPPPPLPLNDCLNIFFLRLYICTALWSSCSVFYSAEMYFLV